MKVKAQMGMVLNLDKCLGCHTCSIPCKNFWTTRPGTEYMWFNNVETKPGAGYPRHWENQKLHRGGWTVEEDGHGKTRLHLRSGGKFSRLANIFANPHLPKLDDYYEPWNYNYAHLTTSPPSKHLPTARMYSSVTGEPMTPQWGVNWEDDLAGAHVTGLDDPNFSGLEAKAYLQFKQVFMLHLPRICEHCLNPACVASCPSGAMYKRDEDGIVLTDQTRCRSWRFCVSGCPYKKVYFNWKEHHSEKCLFCYPRLESGQPSLCAQSCTGRIRYIGVLLYDADKVHELAATPKEHDLYAAQLSVFLDPDDPEVRRQAHEDGIPHTFMEAARRSPLRKLVCDWKLALPLHPEFRTLPMVWYIPPASPLLEAGQSHWEGNEKGEAGLISDESALDRMRIPLRYLANLLTAGDEVPVRASLLKLMLLRRYMRMRQLSPEASADGIRQTVLTDSGQDGVKGGLGGGIKASLRAAGLSEQDVLDMYRLLAVARYDDRFVIPTVRRENALGEDMETLKGHAGFATAPCDAQGPLNGGDA